MKKLFGIPLVAIVLFIGVGGAGAALAYVVSGLSWDFSVEEPIVVTIRPETPVRKTVMPGEEFTVSLEARNRSESASYGMRYWGMIYWANYGFDLNAQSVNDNVVVLDKPQTSGKSLKIAPAAVKNAGGIAKPYSRWGTVQINLDPDGPGEAGAQPYLPGTTVIKAKGIHWLYLTVRPAADIPPGEWQIELIADRGEPDTN